jgi:hypothetical protein
MWEELRSELFLILMIEGQRIRNLYHDMDKPEEIEFDSWEYNIFKPILTVGMATGDPEVINSLIEFANSAYRRKTDHYNDRADENILLRALLDIVPQDGWYSSEALKDKVISFVNENGIQMEQALTRNRLGTLMTNMGLYAEKTRRTIENKKITLYRVEISNIIRIAENYQVDIPGQTRTDPLNGGYVQSNLIK